jgi:N-methylhydantoinase B
MAQRTLDFDDLVSSVAIGAARSARTVIYRAGGGEEVVPSKLVTTLQAGDRIVFETAGGGGYGDPARRDPHRVRADLADGKISAAGVKIYGPGRDGAS